MKIGNKVGTDRCRHDKSDMRPAHAIGSFAAELALVESINS